MFKKFIHEGIESTERILQEQLFFGSDLPALELDKIVDDLNETASRFSFLTSMQPQNNSYSVSFIRRPVLYGMV